MTLQAPAWLQLPPELTRVAAAWEQEVEGVWLPFLLQSPVFAQQLAWAAGQRQLQVAQLVVAWRERVVQGKSRCVLLASAPLVRSAD